MGGIAGEETRPGEAAAVLALPPKKSGRRAGVDAGVRCGGEGADTSLRVWRGESGKGIAAINIIRHFFDQGASVRNGQLLYHAVERTQPDIIKSLDLLLAKGASLDEKKYDGDPFYMGLGASPWSNTSKKSRSSCVILYEEASIALLKTQKGKLLLTTR